jgi:hypothetical protein
MRREIGYYLKIMGFKLSSKKKEDGVNSGEAQTVNIVPVCFYATRFFTVP